MVEITFAIEGTEHGVTVDPAMGHPREVYESSDKVVAAVERLGYEFVDSPPTYQELSRAHRKSGDAEVVPLDDISARVSQKSGGNSSEMSSADEEAERTVELVGPDGQGIERSYRGEQNLTQVKADLASYHGIDRKKTVRLYDSTSLDDPLDTEREIEEFAGGTLYWDLTQR